MTITRRGQLTAETQFTGDFLTDGATAAVISSTKAKTGTYSYRHTTATSPMGLAIPATSQFRAGYWVNHIGPFSGGRTVIFRWFSGADQNQIYWDEGDNELKIQIDSVEVDTLPIATSNLNRNDTWMHVALHFKAHASAGYISLYVDGVLVFTYSGNTGGNIDSVYFGGNRSPTSGWGAFAYFDDFYVDDAVGEIDVAPPSKRFLFSLVDGAGADAQFTPSAGSNFQNVDDSGAPDGDTTYNKALSAGLKDTFTLSNITLPADHVIRAAIVLAVVKRTDAGTASQIKLHSYDGATYQSGSAQTPPTSYNTLWERQTLQPDGSAWNETDFNAMNWGYESAGSF